MSTGTIKWFNDSKGFGFITPDDGSGDLFLHFRDLAPGFERSAISEGQRVSYRGEMGLKGPIREGHPAGLTSAIRPSRSQRSTTRISRRTTRCALPSAIPDGS